MPYIWNHSKQKCLLQRQKKSNDYKMVYYAWNNERKRPGEVRLLNFINKQCDRLQHLYEHSLQQYIGEKRSFLCELFYGWQL